jgi:hypothetical protein
VSLFFLSVGVVGYLRGALPVPERALLVAAACVMVLYPIGFSGLGLTPLAVGTGIAVRNVVTYRRSGEGGLARV